MEVPQSGFELATNRSETEALTSPPTLIYSKKWGNGQVTLETDVFMPYPPTPPPPTPHPPLPQFHRNDSHPHQKDTGGSGLSLNLLWTNSNTQALQKIKLCPGTNKLVTLSILNSDLVQRPCTDRWRCHKTLKTCLCTLLPAQSPNRYCSLKEKLSHILTGQIFLSTLHTGDAKLRGRVTKRNMTFVSSPVVRLTSYSCHCRYKETPTKKSGPMQCFFFLVYANKAGW